MKLPPLTNLRALVMVFALIIICIFFHLLTHGIFLSPQNIVNLFRQSSIVALLAIGMVLVIVSGNIDLSVGSMVGLMGGASAILAVRYQMSLPVAIVLTLTFGILAGACEGFLIAYLKIPAFIVTLGGLLIFRGWISAWMKGETIPVSSGFQFIGGGFLTTAQGWGVTVIAILVAAYSIYVSSRSRSKHGLQAESFAITLTKIFFVAALFVGFMLVFANSGTVNSKPPITTPIRVPQSSPLFSTIQNEHVATQAIATSHSIPIPVIIMIVLALLFSFIATRTVFGRRVFAIGGNAEAAFLSGINIKWNTMLVFALMGLMSAIAGIIYTARLGSAAPDAARGYELYAIAACVIGGTSLSGGRGTIFGAIIGALIMASLDSGMSIMNVDPFFQDIIKGAVLVLAVYIDVASKKARDL